jgi:hypothetical protein
VPYSFDRRYLTTTTPVIHKIMPNTGLVFMPKRKATIKSFPVIYKGAPMK